MKFRHKFNHDVFEIAEFPFAQLPAPVLNKGGAFIASDLGPLGTLVSSDGVRYRPVNGRARVGGHRVVVGIAPTFTGGADGAVTFGTALPRSGVKGYFYYGAGTLAVGQAAGFYLTVMSSTTEGVVFNNTYTPALNTLPTPPEELVVFEDAIVGGAGVTTPVVVYQFALPGTAMGLDGELSFDTRLENNNNADDKTLTVKFGGTAVGSLVHTTTTGANLTGRVGNTGVPAEQYTDSGSAAVDTAVAVAVSLTLQLEAATSVAIVPRSDFFLTI